MTDESPGRHSRLFLVLSCWLLAACDTHGEPSEVHLDDLPRLNVTAEARLGDFDDPDIGFTRVSAVDVDADGRIYVLEAAVPEIRVYEESGALLRRIGRRGEGPGEFRSAPRFGVVGETIWTFDAGLNRITLFDREGRLLSTGRTDGLPVALPSGYGYALPWRMRRDGMFTSRLIRVTFLRPDDPPTGVSPTDSIPVPIVLFDATGRVTDTIGYSHRPPPRLWRPPAQEGPETQWIQVVGERRPVPNPPTELPWTETTLGGYVEVDSPLPQAAGEGRIEVTRFGLHSDTLFHRTLLYEPIRWSDTELDSIAARGARGIGGVMRMGGGTPPVPENVDDITRALRAAMDFPTYQIPLQFVRLNEDESVWLRMVDDDGPTAHWVLIDPDGTPRGRLELPTNVQIIWHRTDEFWAVEPDEFEVAWLVRYRTGSFP